MAADVHKFIKFCPNCQKTKVRKIHNIPKPFVTSDSMTPMRSLCIDTIGELPAAGGPSEHRYVLVILDNFSRWVELYPMASTSAIDAADALLDHFCRYGDPIELQMDRGSQFVNELVAIITERK